MAAFAADLLFVGCNPYLGDGHPQRLLEALQKLRELEAQVFVPGHGPVGSRADLELLIEYVEGCIETARKLAAGGPVAEERFAALQPPEKFAAWKLSRFYPANIKFLCGL